MLIACYMNPRNSALFSWHPNCELQWSPIANQEHISNCPVPTTLRMTTLHKSKKSVTRHLLLVEMKKNTKTCYCWDKSSDKQTNKQTNKTKQNKTTQKKNKHDVVKLNHVPDWDWEAARNLMVDVYQRLDANRTMLCGALTTPGDRYSRYPKWRPW